LKDRWIENAAAGTVLGAFERGEINHK